MVQQPKIVKPSQRRLLVEKKEEEDILIWGIEEVGLSKRD